MEGKTALVTGAGRGIGLEVCRTLAHKGFSVYLNCRTLSDEAEALISEGRVSHLFFDVCDKETLFAARNVIGSQPLDLLVNNAGINRDNILYSQTEEEWDNVIETNYTAALRVYETFKENLSRAQYPLVVNITSIAGIKPKKGQGAYSVSKAMLAEWTRIMAQSGEMDFYALSPGPVATLMTQKSAWYNKPGAEKRVPVARFGKPEEIGDMIFTLSQTPRFIKNGSNIVLDGGFLLTTKE